MGLLDVDKVRAGGAISESIFNDVHHLMAHHLVVRHLMVRQRHFWTLYIVSIRHFWTLYSVKIVSIRHFGVGLLDVDKVRAGGGHSQGSTGPGSGPGAGSTSAVPMVVAIIG